MIEVFNDISSYFTVFFLLIQEHAERLHKDFPDMYKDPNHKPELAIALTPFEALCGFRRIAEIQEFFRSKFFILYINAQSMAVKTGCLKW